MLKMGYCIARVNSIEKPFLLYIPYIKRHSLTLDEINANNQRLLEINEIEENEVNKNLKMIKKMLNRLFQYTKNFTNKIKSIKLKKHSLPNLNEIEDHLIADEDLGLISLEKYINELVKEQNVNKNHKSVLHEFCQKKHLSLPAYTLISKSGPNHSPSYTIELIIKPGSSVKSHQEIFKGNNEKIKGNGKNKKSAENDAAEKMCEALGLLN